MSEIIVDDVPANIVANIWVGSYLAAKQFVGIRINVHHDCNFNAQYQIPLLNKKPNSHEDRSGAKVNPDNLATLHNLLDYHYYDHVVNNLLIHCHGGIERSPLVIATWLQRTLSYTLDEAYDLIRASRPQVQDRRIWLEQ